MRFNLITIFALVLISVGSCSKSSTPTPNPTPPTDTTKKAFLATGWSQVQVGLKNLTDIAYLPTGAIYTIREGTNDTIFRSGNDGTSWSFFGVPYVGTGYSFNLYVTPDEKVFVTSIEPSNGGYFHGYLTKWNGAGFDTVHVGKPVSDLYMIGNKGWSALAAAPFLSESSDTGKTWQDVQTGIDPAQLSATQLRYASLHFQDSLHGALGVGSDVFVTSSGVQHWTKVAGISGSAYITKVFTAGSGVYYAANDSGAFYKSTDGQQMIVQPNFPAYQKGLSGFTDFHFFDPQEGYAVFRDCVYHTLNGGNKWDTVAYLPGKTMVELDFYDRNHGAACVGDGGVLLFKQ
jgi:hypothetical protein